MAAVVAAFAAGTLGGIATAQQPANTAAEPCNPVIDGTYCATQGGRAGRGSSSSVNMGSIQSLSGDLSLGQDSPATFAGISFNSGSTTCIGLFRRASCN
jgi:hypothetical protein